MVTPSPVDNEPADVKRSRTSAAHRDCSVNSFRMGLHVSQGLRAVRHLFSLDARTKRAEAKTRLLRAKDANSALARRINRNRVDVLGMWTFYVLSLVQGPVVLAVMIHDLRHGQVRPEVMTLQAGSVSEAGMVAILFHPWTRKSKESDPAAQPSSHD